MHSSNFAVCKCRAVGCIIGRACLVHQSVAKQLVCSGETARTRPGGDSPLHLRNVCTLAAPNTEQIQQGIDWAKEQLAAGQSVYVHCAHGHGRSATVLAALLIATGQASTAEEAVEIMRWVSVGSRELTLRQRTIHLHQCY